MWYLTACCNHYFLMAFLNWYESCRAFCGCHHDLVSRHGISVSQMSTDMLRLLESQSGPVLMHALSPICIQTGATSRAGTAYPSRVTVILVEFLLL